MDASPVPATIAVAWDDHGDATACKATDSCTVEEIQASIAHLHRQVLALQRDIASLTQYGMRRFGAASDPDEARP